MQAGQLIRQARAARGWSQEALADKARVSRAVLSRLEQGKPKPVQTDTVDRLMAALELRPQLQPAPGDSARRVARLEQDIRRRELRERHLRLALTLADHSAGAGSKIAKAKERVALWRRSRSCSPFYIERWSALLALPPRKLAARMHQLGEWEDAMFQNSPWSWAWT